MDIAIQELALQMRAKRGSRGVRAAAGDIEISSATYSRIENGHMPDLATFAKICRWLGRDPNDFLGVETDGRRVQEDEPVQVHLRKRKTVPVETAESLGALILAVQAAARAHTKLLG
jgi:transcriptional regulator with XRE-family HTH domain